jgi:hypothetical protein
MNLEDVKIGMRVVIDRAPRVHSKVTGGVVKGFMRGTKYVKVRRDGNLTTTMIYCGRLSLERKD